MNINYEDIITSANTRKEALKALEAELHGIRDVADELLESLRYFVRLAELRGGLDVEGQKLLGVTDGLIFNVGGDARKALSILFGASSSEGTPAHQNLMQRLVEAATS